MDLTGLKQPTTPCGSARLTGVTVGVTNVAALPSGAD